MGLNTVTRWQKIHRVVLRHYHVFRMKKASPGRGSVICPHTCLRTSRKIQPVTVRRLSSVTVNHLLDAWEGKMVQGGVSEPRLSVELIVAHAFGKKMIHEVDLSLIPTEESIQNIENMCRQRLTRCPVQYIIGEWDFFDLTLEMCKPVLIPRPETENLTEHILRDWKRSHNHHRGTFLEIGSGTGAISIYLLKHLPEFEGVAMDINIDACHLTNKNATRHNVIDRLHIIHGDVFNDGDVSKVPEGSLDFIVSNPPYITSDEMDNLEPEINSFEDHRALIAGPDGLDVIRRILAISSSILKPRNGLLWLEVGLGHPEMIEHLIETDSEYGLSYMNTLEDFTKRGRFCKLQAR